MVQATRIFKLTFDMLGELDKLQEDLSEGG